MTDSSIKKRDSFGKMSISALEADIAYFRARRALVAGMPDTLYRRAQLRVCDLMEASLSDTLKILQERRPAKKNDN